MNTDVQNNSKAPRVKIIVETGEYGFTVHSGGKLAEVGFDEMLGLVAAIAMPETRPCLQWLKTPEQIKDFEERMKARKPKTEVKNDN